ncbi:hypothetical protein KM043_003692 [Ampulex compressa]|nr:hypothetical protein KM043_003692 [Ampulex compressa]
MRKKIRLVQVPEEQGMEHEGPATNIHPEGVLSPGAARTIALHRGEARDIASCRSKPPPPPPSYYLPLTSGSREPPKFRVSPKPIVVRPAVLERLIKGEWKTSPVVCRPPTVTNWSFDLACRAVNHPSSGSSLPLGTRGPLLGSIDPDPPGVARRLRSKEREKKSGRSWGCEAAGWVSLSTGRAKAPPGFPASSRERRLFLESVSPEFKDS